MGSCDSCDGVRCPSGQCCECGECSYPNCGGIFPAKNEQGNTMIDDSIDKESTQSSILMSLNQIEIEMRYIIYILITMIIIWILVKILNYIKARSAMQPLAQQAHKPMKLPMDDPESDE